MTARQRDWGRVRTLYMGIAAAIEEAQLLERNMISAWIKHGPPNSGKWSPTRLYSAIDKGEPRKWADRCERLTRDQEEGG